ncbi:uncharacterized protein [Ptychodera flava]|uniref:uncharacterized protein n=1 Tax=Ptychodera flava TaxID=63121 RepID=UPI003969DD8E
MLSDNASTYISGAEEIRSLLDTPDVRDYLSSQRVKWTFIPKRAPWFGGFWERLISLTKNAIKKVLGRSFITYDELATVVTEIETVLNDRPLTFVSSSADDDVSLTPNHLLHGRSLTSLPYITVSDEETKTRLLETTMMLTDVTHICQISNNSSGSDGQPSI